MKLPPFAYHRPATVEDAVALLARYGGEARPLSGGQSLLPMMALRLVSPEALVDLGAIAELERIALAPDGARLGARVTWAAIEAHDGLARAQPLLREAVGNIAHYQIRNRGTVGGSLAHADPAAEFPAVALVCDAVVHVAGPQGTHSMSIRDFHLDAMETALGEDEIVTRIDLPAWPAARRWAFSEFATRAGDFAVAGIGLHFSLDGGGRIEDPRLVGFGVGDRPLRLTAAEDLLAGEPPSPEIFRAAADIASDGIDPQDEPRFPADYRRSLLGTLLRRALHAAMERKS